ncbi:MAG: ribonuclease H-like domain-containing protein [Myxococcales bacterium]|nr:ribonuclease H-like domain-containing protein [Myxococcales bacterium]
MSIKRSLARLAHTPPRRLDVAAVRGALPGQCTQTEHGELHLIDEYLEPHHHHGRAPIAKALQVSSERLAQLALDPTLEEVDISRALFFDTETTGLAGGTGTVPFLIGIGWFEDESLRIQQLFLPELGREAPMLHWLRERIRRSSCLVSFNGKTFDWPLLRNRFVMNRVRSPELPPHLDLLHCARRILKRRLRSIRLVELEREVLGMYREDDVSGALIPQLYFDYLDGGDVSPIAKVIEHNANDLIALAALVAELVSHFDEIHREDDPRDHLSYARVAERAGDPCRARSFARAAADGGGEAACTVEACLLTARMARRSGDVEEEERALLEALRAADDDELRASVRLMLSKHYEHRRKDLERALEHAAGAALAEGEEATERRVARLERRLARHT